MTKPLFVRICRGWLQSFVGDRRGSIAVVAAVTASVLVIGTGVSFDLAQAYSARLHLQNAVDAAALAVGANSPNALSVTQQMQTVADGVVTANVPNGNGITVSTPVVTLSGQSVVVSATATVATSFLSISNIQSITVSASGTALRTVSGLEVVLLLDNTASITNANLALIKSGANTLLSTLFGNTVTNNQLVKVAIVPFGPAVNPGTVAAHSMINASASGWTGCVVERYSTFSHVGLPYSGSSAIYNTIATDLDTAAVAAANAGSAQQSLLHDPSNASSDCPVALQTFTSTLSTATTKINAMNNALFGTNAAIGMSWTYRLLSPSGPFADAYCWPTNPAGCGRQAPNVNWKKVVVLMTDGMPTVMGNTDGNGTASGNAAGSHGCSATKQNYASGSCLSGTHADLSAASSATQLIDMQESAACDALRAKGVVIYTVYFNDGESLPVNYVPAVSYCAGTTAGDGTNSGYFYNAADINQLTAAFTRIGNLLTNLRLSQ